MSISTAWPEGQFTFALSAYMKVLEVAEMEKLSALGLRQKTQSRLKLAQTEIARTRLALQESEAVKEMVVRAFAEERSKGQEGLKKDVDCQV